MKTLHTAEDEWLARLLELRGQANALLAPHFLREQALELLQSPPELNSTALPHLVPLFSYPDAQVAQLAARLAVALIPAEPEDLISLGNSFKELLHRNPWSRDCKLDALQQGFTLPAFAAARRWLLSGNTEQTATARRALALFTLSSNGYVREHALAELAQGFAGGWLPFAIVRLADWVPEVQRLAGDLLLAHLKAENFSAYLRCTGLLAALGPRAGALRAKLNTAIERLALSLPSPQPLLEQCKARSAPRCVFALNLLLLHPAGGAPLSLKLALAHRDKRVQRWAAQRFEPTDVAQLAVVLEALPRISDANAVRLLIDQLPESTWAASRPALEALALSPRSGPQASALFYLRKRYAADCTALLLPALGGKTKQQMAALLGLASLNWRPAAHQLRARLSDRRPKIRRVALRFVGSLSEQQRTDALLQALLDPARRVAQEAVRILRSKGGLELESMARRLLETDNADPRWPQSLMALLMPLGAYTRTELLLDALSRSAPGQQRNELLALLEEFGCADTTRAPSVAEVRRLLVALGAVESILPPKLARGIRIRLE